MTDLRGVPLLLFHAWELHVDNMLREYALATGPGYPYTSHDVMRAKQAREAVGEAVRHAERSAPSGATSVDTVVPSTGGSSAGNYSTLQAVLEHGNELARQGDFLTLPPLPEIVALRDWFCTEVIEQAAGREPVPWRPGAVQVSDMPPAEWAGVEELPTDRAWLVGDDQNRIIAASDAALALLGWPEGDLVGQRLLAVIPPVFREAHVAAFAHATVSGEYRLLGTPLAVQAWTRSGEMVPITLTLEKHGARRGRTVFVGWLDPPLP